MVEASHLRLPCQLQLNRPLSLPTDSQQATELLTISRSIPDNADERVEQQHLAVPSHHKEVAAVLEIGGLGVENSPSTGVHHGIAVSRQPAA